MPGSNHVPSYYDDWYPSSGNNHVPRYHDDSGSTAAVRWTEQEYFSWLEQEEFARRLRPNRRLALSEAVQSSIDRVGINLETLSFLRFNRRSTEPIEFDEEQLEIIERENAAVAVMGQVDNRDIHYEVLSDTNAYLNYVGRIVDTSVEQTEQEFHDSLLFRDLFELVIDIDYDTFSSLRMGMQFQEGWYGGSMLGEEADIIREMRDDRYDSYDWESDMEEEEEELNQEGLDDAPTTTTIPVIPVEEVGKDACCICYVNVPNAFFPGCGHSEFCPVCADRIVRTAQRCPLCRADAKSYFDIPFL